MPALHHVGQAAAQIRFVVIAEKESWPLRTARLHRESVSAAPRDGHRRLRSHIGLARSSIRTHPAWRGRFAACCRQPAGQLRTMQGRVRLDSGDSRNHDQVPHRQRRVLQRDILAGSRGGETVERHGNAHGAHPKGRIQRHHRRPTFSLHQMHQVSIFQAQDDVPRLRQAMSPRRESYQPHATTVKINAAVRPSIMCVMATTTTMMVAVMAAAIAPPHLSRREIGKHRIGTAELRVGRVVSGNPLFEL
mmetsp:Transcript_7291/g.19733  ORF Transcript_7291/g.19733 Transcript_7291/m.19733 type:complete len:248 (+) Transcript_7291:272-1015(+)